MHKDKILEYQRDVIFEYLNEAINLVTASNVYMLANDKHRLEKKEISKTCSLYCTIYKLLFKIC